MVGEKPTEKTKGLSHFLLGHQRLGRKSQNQGSVLFILTCEWVRVNSQIQDSRTLFKHTPVRVRMCALCTSYIPASELQRGLCTCSLLARLPEQAVDYCPCSHQSSSNLPRNIQTEVYLIHMPAHISREKLLFWQPCQLFFSVTLNSMNLWKMMTEEHYFKGM